MGEPKEFFMLCESCIESDLKNFNKENWKANIKYDGERVIAVKKGEDILLFNRRGNILNYKFNEIVEALSKIRFDFMIDGEIISFNNDFTKLQRRALTKDRIKIKQLEKDIPVKYMIFDILFYDNLTLKGKPLKERLSFLNLLFFNESKSSYLELVEYGEIYEMWGKAKNDNGEGIIIKNLNGIYESNKRSKDWIKCKLFKEGEMTITGYTINPKGIRATDKNDNAVQIAGEQSKEVKDLLDTRGEVTILIQYLEKTKENKLRFPSYRGFKKTSERG